MKLKNKFYCVFMLLMMPMIVSGLGLGNIEVQSNLNAPFEAKVPLLSPTASELDSLKVGLADSEAFRRAGVERSFYLANLKFEVEQDPVVGDYIRIHSQDIIREPIVNFLLEISWEGGRLYREYTALLNPPLYDSNKRKPVLQQPTVDTSVSRYSEDQTVVESTPETKSKPESPSLVPDSEPSTVPDSTEQDFGFADGYQVQQGDTLWAIASEIRPDYSVSINQMMLALQRANPEAFAQNNINFLKRGRVLKMPSAEEMSMLTKAQASIEAKAQHSAWGQVATPRAISNVDQMLGESNEFSPAGLSSQQLEDSELRVVTDESTDKQDKAQGPSSGSDSKVLSLAQEELTRLQQENTELKDKIAENEEILDSLKKLLELKDDELARLQNQMQSEVVAPTPPQVDVLDETQAPELEQDVEMPVEDVESSFDEAEAVDESPEQEPEMSSEIVEDVAIAGNVGSQQSGKAGQATGYLAGIKLFFMQNLKYAIIAVVIILVIIGGIIFMQRRNVEEIDIEDDGFGLDSLDSSLDENFDKSSESDKEFEDIFNDAESEPIPEVAGHEMQDQEVDLEVIPDQTIADVGDNELEGVDEIDQMGEYDDDAHQELNTYLAFEQFDQAEDLVRTQISAKPDVPELYIKLLEVFYTAGNKKAYEEEARKFEPLVNGQGKHWDMVQAMWAELSPNRALFEAGGDDSSEEENIESNRDSFVDLGGEASEEESSPEVGSDPEPESDSDDMSMDFDSVAESQEESVEDDGIEIEDYASSDSDESDSGDMSMDFDPMAEEEDDSDEAVNEKTEDLGALSSGEDLADLALDEGIEDDLEMEGDIGDFESPVQEAEEATATLLIDRQGAEVQSLEQEVSAKLDLAKAYVELGDQENAKNIIDEILVEGTEAQKKQAQELQQQI